MPKDRILRKGEKLGEYLGFQSRNPKPEINWNNTRITLNEIVQTRVSDPAFKSGVCLLP